MTAQARFLHRSCHGRNNRPSLSQSKTMEYLWTTQDLFPPIFELEHGPRRQPGSHRILGKHNIAHHLVMNYSARFKSTIFKFCSIYNHPVTSLESTYREIQELRACRQDLSGPFSPSPPVTSRCVHSNMNAVCWAHKTKLCPVSHDTQLEYINGTGRGEGPSHGS